MLFISTSFIQNSKMNIAIIDLVPTEILKKEAQFVSSRFSVGIEMILKGGGKCNISDQIPDNIQDDDTVGILYPEEINSTDLIITLSFGYSL